MGTPEEDLQEFLERLDIDVEDTVTIKRFQTRLDDLIPDLTENQVDSLFEAAKVRYEKLAPSGVRPIIIKYPSGSQLRFTLPHERGLFSYESVKALLRL